MLTKIDNDQICNVIKQCEELGVVLDYVVFKVEKTPVSYQLHKEVALAGMRLIGKKHKSGSIHEMLFENAVGRKITFSEFWGNDDALKKKMITEQYWMVPNVDGYKTAFFNPPHGLKDTVEEQLLLFDQINQLLLAPLGEENLQIYKWPIDWSDYFDDGKEWWGAFYWTINNTEKDMVIVIGASVTD